ncbi:MAG TPA: glucokinase [Deltaproteobacteria bacterium]|nr:glucokinase [Deltaproteobacteria bacterium]
MFIAGDVGGTKTNLGVYKLSGSVETPVIEDSLPTSPYETLESLVRDFLSKHSLTVEFAVFGVAGPVVGSRATITNLPWIIEEEALKSSLGLSSVKILNDLEAIAYGVPVLHEKDLFTLNEGKRIQHGPMAVIAPGTGLGEAYITWDGTHYVAHASEGGHVDFAPRCREEIELLSYLLERFNHVSYERICSGMGIPNIYNFLSVMGYYEEPAWFAGKLESTHDKTALILTTALEDGTPCERCTKTLELFLSILGAEAGNMALKVLATGGIYLGGGILPRIISVIADSPFMESFTRKGRLSHIISDIPVNVILNPKVALMGAATFGLSSLYKP